MGLEREYLDITYLHENGFKRRRCSNCGKYFWSTTDREICGDPPCGSYTFINNPIFNKKMSIDEMREFYLSFFEKRGHERIDRYPVVARWRDDIYLTIASIADFQPFVTSGVVPPPANPLTISQPCIRLEDLDSIGKTGRHLSLFEMMAHHAFNSPQNEIYWKNETVAYCTELLNKLGVEKDEIIYKEEPWAGGGNAGPCLEAIVGGLELATLVFMNLEEDPGGDIEIKGERYKRMDNYIVDTGYGLERFTWASQGTPTIYDAIFPKVIDKIIDNSDIGFSRDDDEVVRLIAESSKIAGIMSSLKGEALLKLRRMVSERVGISIEKLEKVITPLERAYALADHTRAILFMLGDGLVPSNAGAGYLARLMIRRSMRLAEEINFKLPIYELVKIHRKILKNFSFDVPMSTIQEILTLEEDRYKNTIARGISLVERTLNKVKKIGKRELLEFYDSHGLPPEFVISIAKKKGAEVEQPEDFYSELASKHTKVEKKVKRRILKNKYKETERLYYNPKLFEFEAEIIGVEGDLIILNKTAFYPESGGQDNDIGYFYYNGEKIEVIDVFEENGVIVHRIRSSNVKIKPMSKIKGVIDRERRMRLTKHHSATHLLLYALQNKLGKHVWQAGAKKEYDKARLDVTHFKKLNEEEIREIEMIVNREIMANKAVSWEILDRIDAEKRYGFRVYQGGVPQSKNIRIVRVGDDVQACGGTHVEFTGEIGTFKIIRVESIQDGIIRFEYSAGESALEYISKEESILREASSILRVEPSILPKTVLRFFEEWKDQKKEIEKLKDELSRLKAEKFMKNAEEIGEFNVIVEVVDDMQTAVKIGQHLANANYIGCLLVEQDGAKIVTFSGDKRVDARDLIKEIGKYIKGSGGGRRDLAQGAGQIFLDKNELTKIIFRFLSRHLKL